MTPEDSNITWYVLMMVCVNLIRTNQDTFATTGPLMDVAVAIYDVSQIDSMKTEVSQILRQTPLLNSVWTDIMMERQRRKMLASTEDYDF